MIIKAPSLNCKKRDFLYLFFILIFTAGLFTGCATSPPPQRPSKDYPKPYQVFGKWYQPLPDANDFREKGTASWYGEPFHGRKTANGETYNMYEMTAAHKTLPLGTLVSVRNLNNNIKIEVRINDRGPFVGTRIIDLSYAAAKKINMVDAGTAKVEVIAMGTPTASASSQYIPVDLNSENLTIQVGAFKEKDNAIRFKEQLENKYKNVHVTAYDSRRLDMKLYGVRIGKCSSLKQAHEYKAILIENGYQGAFTIAD
ncbi:MAG: septal ring lytic transglycosylase RlpA family protein [Desulfobacterales bacterium]|nr:septal ring lytic transglycosylase RlpA family protein [Desulfobacterales bacterium]